MLEPMRAAVGNQNGGTLSTVLIGKIHVVCQTKAEKRFAQHCLAKQCLGLMEKGTPKKPTSRIPTQAALQNTAFWFCFTKES